MRSQLRLLSEMRARVSDWLGDTVSGTFLSTKIDAQLESALETLCNLLVADNQGKRCLRKVSDEIAIVADQQDYALPTDCLRVDRLQYSFTAAAGTREWQDLPFDITDAISGAVRSGTDAYLASVSAGKGTPSRWNDSADLNGYIRIYPTPAVAAEYLRYRYYFAPEFPVAVPTSTAWVLGTNPYTSYTAGQYVTNGGSYYLCSSSHSASAATQPGVGASWETVWTKIYVRLEGVPVGFDTAIEYLAAAMLSGEELEDGKPIGYFGQEFRKQYTTLVNGVAGGQVRPQRRYINMV
jgi:hypothetical protein